MSTPVPDTVAAIDLGSNSFHMIIARPVGGQLQIVDRIRDRVQLAAGLDDDGRLDEDVAERALACLSRLGQRVRDLPPDHVRAVGTNTLRKARNAKGFLAQARKALGHRIEVISGREEARLIYLGVAHTLADDAGRRLVVDIGGGSTELIIGERFETVAADSLYMGCVSYSRAFFDGAITREAMRAARIAARLELQSIERRYLATGWHEAVGASGTINAVASVLRASGWSDGPITAQGLKKLRKNLVARGHVDALGDLAGLASERVNVIAGGVAILSAVFQTLGVERMILSPGALREGLVFDVLGRIRHEDVRDLTIQRLAGRYGADPDQAERVRHTAFALLDQVTGPWSLDRDGGRQLLDWAARLHEVGLAVAYSGHHKHGAYLVANSEMPGFSREDQEQLAVLLRAHRRKVEPMIFVGLPPAQVDQVIRLSVVLRLAVLLNRARGPKAAAAPEVSVHGSKVRLRFAPGWLGAHPLTREDLAREARWLGALDLALEFA